jgi:hypothetical protein
MLDYLEWKEFKYRLERHAKRIGLNASVGPTCCGFTYRCAAFYDGMTVHPDGSITGCARMDEPAGTVEDLERRLLATPRSMHQTCMRDAWGGLTDFDHVVRLE